MLDKFRALHRHLWGAASVRDFLFGIVIVAVALHVRLVLVRARRDFAARTSLGADRGTPWLGMVTPSHSRGSNARGWSLPALQRYRKIMPFERDTCRWRDRVQWQVSCANCKIVFRTKSHFSGTKEAAGGASPGPLVALMREEFERLRGAATGGEVCGVFVRVNTRLARKERVRVLG